MANNVNMERQEDKEGDGGRGADVSADGRDVTKRLLPAAVSSCQDGERAAREGLTSEPERPARRKSAASESRHGDGGGSGGGGSSPAPCQRAAEEPPRLNFHIPRKNKERKALFQHVSAGSREFEDLVNTLTSCYRDCTSAGTFTYTKARLVHSELLEKEFIEKKRELRQDGRIDKELQESFCFLLPDPSKLHSVCEKGLSVGHSRITTLGNPTMGVYLSKYSDLLQMNPFDPGTSGDIIIFKVMKGRVKSIYENISKNVLDPTPKFDCHVSKNAAKVISLRSYRAFELTQQYFYEYSFDEIKSRPRHVCPYAVVSFVYKGKEATPPPKPMAPLRSNSSISEGTKGRSSYTLWNGQLLNGGKAVFQASLQSSTSPFLPIKLPEKLEIGTVMSLEQVKRKIPAVLFSWSTYYGAREVLKSGMYCSLFDVVDRSRFGNSLTVLLHKLERERMVFVSKLTDRGYLFLLSSAQMITASERRPEWTRCLQALFLFQEPRGVSRFSSKVAMFQDSLASESKEAVMPQLEGFIPALHYALMKLRTNPPADLSAGVLRQAWDYLSGRECGNVRLYYMTEYNQNLDERDQVRAAPRKPHSKERTCLRSYLCCPGSYLFTVRQAQEMMESHRRPPEYSPVSDWEGSDSQPVAARSNGAHGPQLAHADNDPEKMKELLRLIHMCKRNIEGEVRQTGEGMQGIWDARGLKRKLEIASPETAVKYLKADSLDNGEHSRDETQRCPSLTAIMNSVGLRDTDLRRDDSQGATKLMKILASINKSTRSSSPTQSESPSSLPRKGDAREGPEYDGMSHITLPSHYHLDLSNPHGDEDPDHLGRNDFLEEQTAGSMSSLEVFSPCSSNEQHRSTELSGEEPIPWVLIPITGIKSEKNPALSLQEDEENSEDQQFGRLSHGSSCASPKTAHCTFPQPVDDDYTEGKGEEEKEEAAGSSKFPCTLSHSAVFKGLDHILDEEFSEFSVEIHDLLKEEHIHYTPELHMPDQRRPLWTPAAPLSMYISGHVSPGPIQSYVTTLHERLSCFMGPEIPPAGAFKTSATAPTQSLSPDPPSVVSCMPSPSLTPTPASSLLSDPDLISVAHASALSSSSTPPPKTVAILPQRPVHSLPQVITSESPEAKEVRKKPEQDSKRPVKQDDGVVVGVGGTVKMEPEAILLRGAADEKSLMAATDSAPLAVDSGSGTPSISSLISQLKPEVFSSLVEIIKDVQKNAVKFYIHSGEEESDVCVEIKEYLMRLGNVECNPQSFLHEQNKNNLDKLLIIIPNVDIAAHVHKIPALVSLKKLPSVSFAGVDSLDDVKNHTYNELFISGGFIVSDEFVLNPEFITCERLQALLKFLEEQSTPENPWQWKVHCKTQKKLKELGRLNSDALSLLNLLATYQKRHLVEFLPYHECDAPSRHAPDLNCLVRLQAHHTQHRHIIFLTVERQFEMFPQYSNNGIMIASIDDFMNSFHSLTGFHDGKEEVPSAEQPSAPVLTTGTTKDECVDEEDMSLDSEEDSSAIEETGESLQKGGECQQPPPPQMEKFQPPLPDQPAVDVEAQATSGATPKQLGFEVLKTAITNFKASSHTGGSPLNFEAGGASPGAFNVNPHQSFLCPTSLQTCYTNISGPQTFPVSPSTAPQEQENKAPASTLAHSHKLPGSLGEAALAQLPPALTLNPPASAQSLSSHRGSEPQGHVDISSSNSILETGVIPPLAPANQDPVAIPSPGVSSFPLGGSRDEWQQLDWSHGGGLGSASGTPTTEDDATGHYATPGNSVSGTPNSQGGGKLANPGSSTPSSQGSLTPLSNTAAPSREATKTTGLLPTPRPGHINGRGRGIGISNHSTVVGTSPLLTGNRPVGPPMGTFRGAPSNGTRAMPRHGLDRRGAACIWGFPRGRGGPRGPSLDFAQGSYPWRESYYHSQGEGYHTHRNDYNGW